MFEIIISLLVAFLFLTASLNLMVFATMLRVEAERKSFGNYWMTDELERMRAIAASFEDCSEDGDENLLSNHFSEVISPIVTKEYLGKELQREIEIVSPSPKLVEVSLRVRDSQKELGFLHSEIISGGAFVCY